MLEDRDTQFEQISSSQLNMNIPSLSEANSGLYACYVHASSGTVRQLIRIQQNEMNNFEVKFLRPTKRINLNVENLSASLNKHVAVLGESYAFDCITG